MLAYAFIDPLIFARHFFQEHTGVKTPPSHQESFMESVDMGNTGQKVNIVAPRGSAKTTFMSVIYPIYRIYFKDCFAMMDMPTTHFIILISRSESVAISNVYDIKRKIESHSDMQWLIPKNRRNNWGVKELITTNDIKIMPKGRGGQVRGALFGAHRPDLIISDDLDDPETVMNPDVRNKDQLWFDSDLIRCGRIDGQSNFINVDTIKHAEATANLLCTRAGWNTKFFRAIEHPADLWHPTQEHLWQQWERLYTDLNIDLETRKAQAQDFYDANETAMTEDVVELWPEMLPYLYVRKEICDVGYYPVLRELQNSTHDPSQALFDMKNALRFEKQQDGLLRSEGWDYDKPYTPARVLSVMLKVCARHPPPPFARV